MKSPTGNPMKTPKSRKGAAPPPPAPAASPAQPTPARRKGAAREWLVVAADGRCYHEEAGKQSIMKRTGLRPRDLRVLDPLLSYNTSILGRERAIVVNLDHIRAIITASELLIANPREPLIEPLVQDLRSLVSASENPPQQEVVGKKAPSSWPSFSGNSPSVKPSPEGSPKVTLQTLLSIDEKGESRRGLEVDLPRGRSTKVLPFEFRALEVFLESACKCLELEITALEKEAYPALDELTSKVSTLNLERVRKIKSRLVSISGRVQKVRDELEHLLDDDMDMAAMYLTEKLAYQAAGGLSSRFDLDKDPIELGEDEAEDDEDEIESSEGYGGVKPNVDELEMLLEAYFVQTDGTLNKLSTLREYVDDTEDYINIMLDDKQNQLLQMGIMLSTATLVTSFGIVIAGVFGINIHIPLYEFPYITFWQTTFGLVGGSLGLYIIAFLCYKKSGLLQ
ncbi:Magnesium transporter MRS2-F [Ananas comosus]|uniref:Magnesium transporter n=1 Tax=Ananas comosus TaxID=4615 RepID=A0A199VR58_ANACO|nr:Magnesium transporter MRS2-F [Ananas comosus]